MMRLIDADALKANCDITIGDTTIGRRDYVMFHEIDSAPTIDVVPKDFHDKTCEAMAKRHTEEIQKLMPKRGEWIEQEDCWQCSECGDEYILEVDVKPIDAKMYYCPNCGARMKGADDE